MITDANYSVHKKHHIMDDQKRKLERMRTLEHLRISTTAVRISSRRYRKQKEALSNKN